MTLTILDTLEQIRPKDVARFYKYVPDASEHSCWEWQSTISHRGYGKFWLNGRTDLAHRASYKMHRGPIASGLMVRHVCDNPPCVNPNHLILGSALDNARDAIERDRYRRGSSAGRAKLTEQQVVDIRAARALGETQVALAEAFGVSRSAIQFALSGRNWAHVEEAS